MARVITILNQKGGVGKTTTVMNLGGYLAMLGQRTLIVDLDPQFNATIGLGVAHNERETIYHAIIGESEILRVVKSTSLARLDLVPASSDLSGALVELLEFPDRNERLRNVLQPLRDRYDFILIDLGPSLNMLTLNGLIASDEILIPVQCEYYSLEGIRQLLETIDLVRKNIGHPLRIAGALLTMYDKREKLSREVAREIRKRFPYHVYDVEIPRSVSLAEAPSYQKPVMLYAPQSPGALAYEALAREIIGMKPEEEKRDFDFVPHREETILKKEETFIPPEPLEHEEELPPEEKQEFSSEKQASPPQEEILVFENFPEPFIIHFHEEEQKND